jgi:DNA-binding transcriptional MerR regulator
VTERSYLSIGDVLALLRDEFPDVTISKIRFLEARGLLDPERTPSGYRKFYDTDVDRLRWILRQQREHFLPLKVIKGRLEGGSGEEDLPVAPSLFDPPGGPAPGCDDPPPGLSEPALVGAASATTGTGGESGLPNGSGGRVGRTDEAPRSAAAAVATGAGAGATGGGSKRKPPGPEDGVAAMAGASARADEETRPAERPPPSEAVRAQSGSAPPPARAGAISGEPGLPAPARTDPRGQLPHPPGETSFGLPPSMTPASAAERDRATPAAAPTHPRPGAPTAAAGPAGTPQQGQTAAPLRGEGSPESGSPASAAAPAAAPADTAGQAAQPRSPAAPEGATAGGAAQSGSSRPRAASEAGTASSAPAVRDRGGPAARSSLGSGVSLTVDELAESCGMSVAEVERLEEYGLIEGRHVAGVKCFDEDGLVIARLSAGFAKYGIEPRHLRSYMHAAEREAGLFSQVVMPLLRQRNPVARSRAGDSLAELTELGEGLHAAFLRIALHDLTGG